jgi:hypothetical protein
LRFPKCRRAQAKAPRPGANGPNGRTGHGGCSETGHVRQSLRARPDLGPCGTRSMTRWADWRGIPTDRFTTPTFSCCASALRRAGPCNWSSGTGPFDRAQDGSEGAACALRSVRASSGRMKQIGRV